MSYGRYGNVRRRRRGRAGVAGAAIYAAEMLESRVLLSGTIYSISGLAGFTLNGANGAGIDGSSTQDNNEGTAPTLSSDNAALTLTTQLNNEASSAFYNTPSTFQNFTASFTYTAEDSSSTNGFTFTLENDSRGPQALAGGGEDLGYSTDIGHPATPISQSFAVEFNSINGTSYIGDATNGGQTAHNTELQYINVGDPINVSISYDYSNSTITETVTDSANGVSASASFTNVNLPTILGANTAYVGFTGGTGSLNGAQTITNFSFSTWTPSKNSPGSVGTMLLLPNGTVMGELDPEQPTDTWALLTPDSTGSYINGTWTKLANANYSRLYFASQVLPDGDVFAAGGEDGTGDATAETYNPLTNVWTSLGSQSYNFSDSNSVLLPDGNVLIAPVGTPADTTIYDPSTNTWCQVPLVPDTPVLDEASWVELPDGSVLVTDGNGNSERYLPASESPTGMAEWVSDAAVPVNLFDSRLEEGDATLLPNGDAFFVGATGSTAIYKPSGTACPGTWSPGPPLPSTLGVDDGPMAMLPDGTVLIAAGPVDTYDGPTTFLTYDPFTNSITTLGTAASIGINEPSITRMLDLPNGQVLYSNGAGGGLYVYSPGISPLASAQPTITSIVNNPDGSLTLTGTGLNGIDNGATYGDDAQMNSNYPIVSLNSGANVYYATSYDWSSTSDATESLVETVNFTLPLGIPAGSYSVTVSANGVTSAGVPLTISTTANNSPPTIATPAAASPATVTGNTADLSVFGADDGGESNLTYTWTATTVPRGAVLPSFSANGTNSAKDTTVTFHSSGNYTFNVIVTDAGGLSTTSTVSVTVSLLPSWVYLYSQAVWNASTSTLTVTGAATIVADPGSDEPNIIASGTAAVLTITPATNPTDIHVGGITLTDGASLVMSDVDASQVASGTNAANHHTDHNVLVIGTLGAVNDPTISIDSASKLDLGDNDLIVHTGSSDTGTTDVQGNMETSELKSIEALAAEGRNVAPGGVYDGTWTGNGLTSSAAAIADSAANAGVEQNILAVEQLSDMFLGVSGNTWTVGTASEMLGANDIIVKYTYNGDLALDGAVDGNAATIFSTFYDNGATSGNTYAYGDLNGDGKIDSNDSIIFSSFYGYGLSGSGLPQL